MINKPNFNDSELSFMNVICTKADPMGVVTQAITIRKKITNYANAVQKQDEETKLKALDKKLKPTVNNKKKKKAKKKIKVSKKKRGKKKK